MRKYRVLGVMSGSSLDGLDLCLTEFTQSDDNWYYEILKYVTVDFSKEIYSRLVHCGKEVDDSVTDLLFGQWIGNQINRHFQNREFGLVSIHGHTTVHKPEENLSRQIGSAKEIAKITNKRVVDNFRIQDIIKGGQGAPLVPVGESYLYPEFNAFLNLGGICNGSIHQEKNVIAWDIAPCNQVFNFFSKKLGHRFDEDGRMARGGLIEQQWMSELDAISYFDKKPPKSISNEWVKNNFFKENIEPRNGLRTFLEFLGKTIANDFNQHITNEAIHVAGGGAHNTFLIEMIKENLLHDNRLFIPSKRDIDNKEALVFGFLGLLKSLNIENVFASVTGASSNTIAGNMHLPTG